MMKVLSVFVVVVLLLLACIGVGQLRGAGMGLEGAGQTPQGDVQGDVVLPGPEVALHRAGGGSAAPRDSPQFSLALTDASTGIVLNIGTVYGCSTTDGRASRGFASHGRSRPAQFDVEVIRDAELPAGLGDEMEGQVLWVTSPGYGWRAVRVHSSVTQMSVPLRRASGIDIEVPIVDPEWQPGQAALKLLVTVSSAELGASWESVFSPIVTRGGEILRVDDVPEGEFVVEARVASIGSAGVLVDRQSVLVSGVARPRVVISMPRAAMVGGSLIVDIPRRDSGPIGSALQSPVVEFRNSSSRTLELHRHGPEGLLRVGRLQIPGTESSPWRERFLCLEPGRYRLGLLPFGMSQEFELFEGGEHLVVFEPSDLAVVRVHVEGELSAKGRYFLTWGYLDEQRGISRTVSFSPRAKSVRIDCEPRPIWAQVVGRMGASQEVRCDPTLGLDVQLAIECRPGQAAYVPLLVGDGGLGGTPGMWFWKDLKVAAVGHDGRLVLIEHVADPRTIDSECAGFPLAGVLLLDSGGPYRLEYHTASGEKVVKRIDVSVDRGHAALHLEW